MSEAKVLNGPLTKKKALSKAARSKASKIDHLIIGVSSTVGCPEPVPVPGPAKPTDKGILVTVHYRPGARPGKVDLLIPWKTVDVASKHRG